MPEDIALTGFDDLEFAAHMDPSLTTVRQGIQTQGVYAGRTLFDLLGAAKAVNADGKWAGFSVEVYLFAGAIYFAFSHGVSRYSQRLERALARSRR